MIEAILWSPSFEPEHWVGVQYVRCACGKHVVHVKRAKQPCPYPKEKR